ncbi:MAG: helix-turn-helix transcriptional regulator [Solirubrobacterales bacterium]|nr:helix-turn-helix transcriptional regulator [Solirubrobacterales bacterium]
MKRFSLEVAARFSENLIRCRKRAGLSQEELGYRASLHRTEVSLLERGVRTPRIDTVLRLAGCLSVPVGDLVAGIEWTPGYTQIVEGGFKVAEQPEPATDQDDGQRGTTEKIARHEPTAR